MYKYEKLTEIMKPSVLLSTLSSLSLYLSRPFCSLRKCVRLNFECASLARLMLLPIRETRGECKKDYPKALSVRGV